MTDLALASEDIINNIFDFKVGVGIISSNMLLLLELEDIGYM